MSTTTSISNAVYNIEKNADVLFERLKFYICMDIVTYIEKIYKLYDIDNPPAPAPAPAPAPGAAAAPAPAAAPAAAGAGAAAAAPGAAGADTNSTNIKKDIEKLIVCFIPFLYLFNNTDSAAIYKSTYEIKSDITSFKFNYTNINYNLFKYICNNLSSNSIYDILLSDSIKRKIIINYILIIIKTILLDKNYIKLNYLYSQICINIYLSETKNLYVEDDYIENKMDSILHLIMRLFTNTLPYYLYNIKYYTISVANAKYTEIITQINSLTFTNNAEKDVYNHLLNNKFDKSELYELCNLIYYSDIGNCNNITDKSTYNNNKKLYGGNSIVLSTISYENPLILLNHINMDLCKLKYIYETINKIINKKRNNFKKIIYDNILTDIYITSGLNISSIFDANNTY